MSGAEKLLLVTFATERTPGCINWERSARLKGHEHLVLGVGQRWDGFMTRVRAYRDFCHGIAHGDKTDTVDKFAGTTLVALTDAYDVLVCAPPDEVVSKFLRFNKPIVFGTERFCFSHQCHPDQPWAAIPNNPATTVAVHGGSSGGGAAHRYLNAGVVVGRPWALAKMLGDMLASGKTDDQLAMGEWASNHLELVAPDTESQIAGNATGPHWQDFYFNRKLKRVVRDATNTTPCFMHVPGSPMDGNYRYNYMVKHILRSEQSDLLSPFPPFYGVVAVLVLLVGLLFGFQWRHTRAGMITLAAFFFILLTTAIVACVYVRHTC